MTAGVGVAAGAALLVALLLYMSGRAARQSRVRVVLRAPLCGSLIAGIVIAGLALVSVRGASFALRVLPALSAAVVSSTTDVQTGYIFDRVVLVALALVTAVAAVEEELGVAVLGALVGAGIPYILHASTAGRGLGLGDVKLAGMLGASLGPAGELRALVIAAVVGGAVATYLLMARRRRASDCMPFGPCLTIGAAVVALGWPL